MFSHVAVTSQGLPSKILNTIGLLCLYQEVRKTLQLHFTMSSMTVERDRSASYERSYLQATTVRLDVVRQLQDAH